MDDMPSGYIERKFNLFYFLVTFVIFFALSFSVLFVLEKEVRRVEFDSLKESETRLIQLENRVLTKAFKMVHSDLHYLHHTIGYHSAQDWVEFSKHRQIYDQIRFIDATGQEITRVNKKETTAYLVPKENLQNKKDRYYFTKTISLKEDEVYVSPLDLNVELGQIEMPYKPVIRFSSPIFDPKGNLNGIIVLNYLADSLLTDFREISENSKGEMMLLNRDGYWLSSQDANLEFGFMFESGKEKTFQSLYPREWDALIHNEKQVVSKNGLFTFQPVALMGDTWYIVSYVPRKAAFPSYFTDDPLQVAKDVLKKNAFYFFLILSISIVVAFLIYINRRTYSRIKYFAEFDSLTKVYNRRAGLAKLNTLVPLDDRRHFVISLCFLDLNGLKQVNDFLGHKFGDELLISVVIGIKAVIRESDFVIRLGGDEFLIVFNGIDAEEAEKVWQRIKARYDEINETENRPYLISVSHGIVSHHEKQSSPIDDLIKRADQKMYEEKGIIKQNFNVLK